MRRLIRQLIIDTRKKDWFKGSDFIVPNLNIRQLIDFSAEAMSYVITEDMTQSFEICGFMHNCSKWSTFVREVLENPQKFKEEKK